MCKLYEMFKVVENNILCGRTAEQLFMEFQYKVNLMSANHKILRSKITFQGNVIFPNLK